MLTLAGGWCSKVDEGENKNDGLKISGEKNEICIHDKSDNEDK